MQPVIKILDTNNNTYVLGYKKICKTTYEQRQERKENMMYFAKQKGLGLLLILTCITIAIFTQDREITGYSVIISLLLGLPLTLVNKRILSI